jgi:hypothetical protein
MKKETIHDLLPKIDEYHQALTPEIRQYLNGRGISDAVINARKIGQGLHVRRQWIVVPIADSKGTVKQVVLRRFPDITDDDEQLRYMLPSESKAALLGADALQSDPDTILCCEGILDDLSAESLGLCAISGTTGAGKFSKGWFDLIPKTPKKRKFIVCFDRDGPGIDGAKEVLFKASEARPDLELCIIELPDLGTGKDLTDFLLQCTAADKKEAILALAKPYTPPTPQERLLEALSSETHLPMCVPSQGWCGTWGYYVVTVRHEGEFKPYVITSDRKCFQCLPEEWMEHGYQIDRMPVVDSGCRWEQKQLIQFLRNEGEALSLADVLQYVRETLIKYVDFTDPRCFSIVAVWIVMTYFYQLFPAVPYLHLTGLKGSGKTKVLQIAALLGFNGELVTSTSSAASITRLVHSSGATLGVDEAEDLWNVCDESSSALQDVLRSGYKKGILVTKCEKDATGNHVVVRLDPFSPKMLSGIRGLEDALSSRCIEVLMLRTTNRKVANTEIIPSASEWQDLRALVYPANLLAMPEVEKAAAQFTVDQLVGRDAELWKPLLVLAKVAGLQDIYNELNSYALEQATKRKDSDGDAEIGKILLCLDELLNGVQSEFITTETIYERLDKEDEFSWITDPKQKSSRGRWLNSRLKRLAVWDGPAEVKSIAGEKKRGYVIERQKLQKAAERHGISMGGESVTSVTESPQSPA